jgi:hypothetical protein
MLQSHKAMALLLGKYDSDTTLSTGNVRGLLDGLVDELLERVVLCGLIDPPQLHLGCSMYNVDTHDFEQYPPRYWVHVAEVCAVCWDAQEGVEQRWQCLLARKGGNGGGGVLQRQLQDGVVEQLGPLVCGPL